MKNKYRLFLFMILNAQFMICLSQVMVVPQMLFIDSKTRSGMVTIINTQNEAKEIDIGLKFGYVKYDSIGRPAVILEDSLREKEYSITPYITFYPKKFVLKSGQEQVIKFMVKNTSDLPDGTYLGRIVSTSTDILKQIDSTTLKDSVKVNIVYKISFVSGLIFQKGKLNTSVEISSANTKTDSANINILFDFKKAGNSPFFGTALVKVYDQSGDEIVKTQEKFSIYFDSKKSFSFEKNKFKSGNYKAEITLTNEHSDVPEENKIKFKEISKAFNFSYNPLISK